VRTPYNGIAQMLVDRRHIGSVKPPIEEQFRELAQSWRGDVIRGAYEKDWYLRLTRNIWRYSPKMICWLARECFDEMYKFYGEQVMPSQSEAGSKEKSEQREWGFINVQLSDDEREAAQLDYQESDTLWDTLVVCLKDGYKVTLSFDKDTDSYCAALSGTNCGKPNERLTLTAWGDNETDALRYVLYKHVTKLEFQWTKNGGRQKRLG
jgi:hypothetical protein